MQLVRLYLGVLMHNWGLILGAPSFNWRKYVYRARNENGKKTKVFLPFDIFIFVSEHPIEQINAFIYTYKKFIQHFLPLQQLQKELQLKFPYGA